MKKVLFTATVDSHIELFHLPFLNWFQEQKYEVHVATNGDNKIPYCDKKFKISFERSPYKINNLKAIFQLKKIILNEKYDIIHCHTPMGSVVTRLAARKARKLYGTKVIYTAHGFHFYKGAPRLNWLLFYPIEKYLSRFTDVLITINKEDYELASKKFKKTKVEYVPGVGLNEEKFNFIMTKKEKLELRKSLGLKENDFVMIYPAELNINKNQTFLIDVMKELVKKKKNIHLLLPGIDSLNGYCQRLSNEMELSKNIHFLGFRNDIPRLLKISDLAVSSSLREGLPLNIMEAMVVGLPIVALCCRGVSDLIINNKNGYIVKKNDIHSFINGIMNVYKNKNEADRFLLFNNGGMEKYLLPAIMKEMLKIYDGEKDKKIILHILSSNSYSGAENVAINIIQLCKNEYRCIYVTREGPIVEILKEKKIPYIIVRKISISEVRKVIHMTKASLIHAHDFRASIVSALSFINVPTISHLHNNPLWIRHINFNSLLYTLTTFKYKKILVVSDAIANEFVFSKIFLKKIINISNPINRKNILSMVKLTQKKKYDVCFVGRLTEQKNPLGLIKIISDVQSQIHDIKVILIGDGELKDKCIHLIEELNLQNNIQVLGFMKNPFEYMNQSKIFVLPSHWEGFGLVVFEALTLGLPCFVSKVGGMVNLVDDSCGKLCQNDDEFIASIISVLKDKKEYTALSTASIEKSIALDNTQSYKKSILNVYDKIID